MQDVIYLFDDSSSDDGYLEICYRSPLSMAVICWGMTETTQTFHNLVP